MIADVLDLTCSLEGCLVQPGVCAPLDELRETLDQLPAILTQVWPTQRERVANSLRGLQALHIWHVSTRRWPAKCVQNNFSPDSLAAAEPQAACRENVAGVQSDV